MAARKRKSAAARPGSQASGADCDCGCCCGCCSPTAVPTVIDEIGPRGTTALTRLSSEDANLIESLVALGMFRSTSQGLAFFLHEGLRARGDLLAGVKPLVQRMRALRNQAGRLGAGARGRGATR